MTNIDYEDKLTDAAREALKELVQDYRNQVLLAAAESASHLTGEVREISVQDLMRGVRSTAVERGVGEPRIFDRLLFVYVVFGVLMALVGFGWFAIRDFFLGLDPQRQIPLLVALAGLALSIFGLFTLRLRQLRGPIWGIWGSPGREGFMTETSSAAHVGLFIAQWQQIELALRTLVGSELGESVAKEPLSALISRLRNEQALDEGDITRLRRLLETRNALVHKGLPLSETNMQVSLRDAQRVLAKLRSRWASVAS
jgi:hypothetical protein